jgi:hypothetical protein
MSSVREHAAIEGRSKASGVALPAGTTWSEDLVIVLLGSVGDATSGPAAAEDRPK